MIRRQKAIDALRVLLDDSELQFIALIGKKGIGKSTLLRELESDGFFGESSSYNYTYLGVGESLDTIEIRENTLHIIDSESIIDGEIWEGFLQKIPSTSRLLFTHNEKIQNESIEHVVLGTISFREYAESQGHPIEIGKIFTGEYDIQKLNHTRDAYIEHGGFPKHLIHPESIQEDFLEIRTVMEQHLFDKEHEVFMDFMRTIAMNVGNLFKADQIAKLLSISRRKVNKYTEILLEQGVVKAVGPWTSDANTETSRHVKLYFTDLAYLKALLGEMHYQGTLKLGALENFIYLELEKKLDETHAISYYRKKSGAEISFILEDLSTGKVTPIEVTNRETEAISQVFRTYDEDYHDIVERYMLVNNERAGRKEIGGTPLIILPHIAI